MSGKSTLQAFSPQNVQNWGPMLNQCLQTWIDDTLSSSSDGTVIDIGEEMQGLTVNVIGKLGFNYNLSREQTETAVHALQLGYLEFSKKYRKYPQRRLLGGLFYPEIRRARQAGRDFNSLGRTTLQHYRENVSAQQQQHQQDDAKQILHYFVNDKDYKNEEERVRDIVVFFAGGYECGPDCDHEDHNHDHHAHDHECGLGSIHLLAAGRLKTVYNDRR